MTAARQPTCRYDDEVLERVEVRDGHWILACPQCGASYGPDPGPDQTVLAADEGGDDPQPR